MNHQILIFDFSGKALGELPIRNDETLRMVAGSPGSDELLFETESFIEPIGIFRYSAKSNNRTLWSKRSIPFDPTDYGHSQLWFLSKDGTRVPMYLVGRRDVLDGTRNPTIMTSYGGYGVSMTPQFSVFVAFLMERGCLFALPNIRGGSEFGMDGTTPRNDATVRPPSTISFPQPNGSSKPAEPLPESSRFSAARTPACSSGRADAAAGFIPRRGLHGSDAGHAALPPVRQRARLERGIRHSGRPG